MHRANGPLFVKGEGMYGQGHGPDEIYNGNSPDPDQPGLWCQWVPNEEGTVLEWDGGEKFYYSAEWMDYIVNRLLSPAAREYVNAHLDEDERLKSFTCNHVVNGEIEARGEDPEDIWMLVVKDNVVEARDGRITYVETRQVTVWTLTVDADEIGTSVFASEQECYESLKENYWSEGDPEFDISTTEGSGALIDWLTSEQGVVLYIDEHTLEVPA